MFVPSDETIRESNGNLEEFLLQANNAIQLFNWIAWRDQFEDAVSRAGALFMISDYRVEVEEGLIDGVDIIQLIEPPFQDGDRQVLVYQTSGFINEDSLNPVEGQLPGMPLDPNEEISRDRKVVILNELKHRILDIGEIEERNYGRTDELNHLNYLWTNITNAERQALEWSTSAFIGYITDMNGELEAIREAQHRLGRRCINNLDYEGQQVFDPKDLRGGVELTPDNEFIRLRNGVCWNTDSLMTFIISQKGYNTTINPATGLQWDAFKAYPGVRTIWQDDAELERIMKHPAMIASDFRAEFNAQRMANQAAESDVVSEETLDMMERTGRLLASEGEVYYQELDKILTEHQREEWDKAERDPMRISNKTDQQEICTSIVVTMKSNALGDWQAYWESLSDAEREFIHNQNSSFTTDIGKCLEGQLCVYITTGILFRTRNQIAQLKGLPMVERMTKGLDPVKACQGISERILSNAEKLQEAENDQVRRAARSRSPSPIQGFVNHMSDEEFEEFRNELRDEATRLHRDNIVDELEDITNNSAGILRLMEFQEEMIDQQNIPISEMEPVSPELVDRIAARTKRVTDAIFFDVQDEYLRLAQEANDREVIARIRTLRGVNDRIQLTELGSGLEDRAREREQTTLQTFIRRRAELMETAQALHRPDYYHTLEAMTYQNLDRFRMVEIRRDLDIIFSDLVGPLIEDAEELGLSDLENELWNLPNNPAGRRRRDEIAEELEEGSENEDLDIDEMEPVDPNVLDRIILRDREFTPETFNERQMELLNLANEANDPTMMAEIRRVRGDREGDVEELSRLGQTLEERSLNREAGPPSPVQRTALSPFRSRTPSPRSPHPAWRFNSVEDVVREAERDEQSHAELVRRRLEEVRRNQ